MLKDFKSWHPPGVVMRQARRQKASRQCRQSKTENGELERNRGNEHAH